MDKQIIEKMAKVLCINDNFICETCPSKNECFNYKHAKQLYNAGYGDLRAFAEKLRNNLDNFKFDIMIYDSELSNLAKEIYIKQLNFIKEKIIDETLNEFLGGEK